MLRILNTLLLEILAEREGFEPPEQLPVHRISSAARSTTPASFLWSYSRGVPQKRVQIYEKIFLPNKLLAKKVSKTLKTHSQGEHKAVTLNALLVRQQNIFAVDGRANLA